MNHQATQRILAASTLAALFAAGIANAAIRPSQDEGRDHPPRKEQRQERKAERSKQDAARAGAERQQRGGDRRDWQQDRRDDRRDAVQQARDDRRDATGQQRSGDGWRGPLQQARDDRRDPMQQPRGDRRDWQQDRRDDQRQEARRDAQRREAQRRDAQYREAQRRDSRDAQRRIAYARYRQDYDRRARDVRIAVVPRYYVRPAHYRYFVGGTWYTTSNYGADVLRQAVDWGYREGLRAGRADRYDGWPADYRDSIAWRDAGFGYGGRYVGRAEYAYYFRQGFERGYDDGYFGRMQYGRRVGADVVIAEAVIAAVLGLQLLR